MSIFILVLSVLFMCVGLIGCFVNRVPGPILTFIGILLFNYGTDYHPFEIYEFENEYVSFRIFSQGKWEIKI